MSTSGENTDYLLDNADPRAEHRFDALGHLFDARTMAYLAALGVTRGWSCSQVGEDMIRHGLCTTAELRSTLELLEDPDFGIATNLLISAWGRRPS